VTAQSSAALLAGRLALALTIALRVALALALRVALALTLRGALAFALCGAFPLALRGALTITLRGALAIALRIALTFALGLGKRVGWADAEGGAEGGDGRNELECLAAAQSGLLGVDPLSSGIKAPSLKRYF
jgi:hypothetical protein